MNRTHWSLARHAGPQRGFSLPDAPKHYPPDLTIEPEHMALVLRVDPERRCATGTNTLRVRARQDGVTRLVLDAIDLREVSVPTPGVRLRVNDRTLELLWDEPFALDEVREVTVAYRVEQPVTGLLFQPYSDELEDAPPFAITDNETERARYWMPCIDHPLVRTTLSFALTTDARFTVLANGVEVGRASHADGTQTTHWALEQRCPSYLACFAIGPFISLEDEEVDGIPCATFALPPFQKDHLNRSFGRTAEMIRWLPKRLGMAFPYPKYFQVAVPAVGGAMENISLVSWDESFLLDAPTATEWTRLLDQINVHEMAHSYFGDAIVCRDFAHAWLKESWATYIEQCWFEHTAGADEARYEYLVAAESYFEEADTHYVRPLVTRAFHSSFEMYDMHLYPGGACRLHNLRQQLGDAVFWQGVSTYVNRYAGKTVETDHFRFALEEVSGRSLGAWFDQWIHSKGYPKLEAKWRWDAIARQGTLHVTQTQMDADAGVGTFTFPLELRFTVAGQAVSRTVDIERAEHAFVFPLAEEPSAIRIDPNCAVLHRLAFLPSEAILRRQLREDEDVLGRILAGRELCKTGSVRNLQAVIDAWGEEPFWGVRTEWAKALVGSRRELAIAALPRLIRDEREPIALVPLFSSVGDLRDTGIETALLARLEEGLPPRAAGEAWRAVGRQRTRRAIERLEEAAERTGFMGWEQGGALLGLGATRHKRGAMRLMRALRPGGCDPRARRWAALAAGRMVGELDPSGMRDDLVEALHRCLDDPNPQVRQYAVRGIRAGKHPSSIAALERYQRHVSQQDRVAAMQVVAEIRDAERSRPSGRDAEVEALERRLRSLEHLVETLKTGPFPRREPEDDGA